MRLFFSIFLGIELLFFYSCTTENSNYPVLVLATNSGFGSYAAEILKTEGFNEYRMDSLTDKKINRAYLRQFDVVILGETPVTQSNIKILQAYVRGGGNLIAFRPDKMLCGIFGVTCYPGTVNEGYIRINTRVDIGRGMVSATIQFHGESDKYKLIGAEEVASLYTNESHKTDFPAVVLNHFGKGQAAAFSYNLSKSIVYTRQGNPKWAGMERDKVDGPTATDLFYPGDGELQWNNPDKIAIPQADEQMRLLSHIIEKFSSNKKPLPRFWYFPDKNKCLFIFTIDGENTPEEDISNEIAEVNNKGAKATLYEIGTYISGSAINTWRSNGNEVAIHFNDVPHYANPAWFDMNSVLDTMSTNFRAKYGFSPKTVRNHWVVWCTRDSPGKMEFAEQAIMEEKYGLGFDCNYYQFGGNKVYPNWLGDVGHFTGSGMPMKFADTRGKIHNIYQSNTQLPDETWLKENIESKSKTMIDRSLDEENYVYINANFHTWYWGECKNSGLRVLDYCNSRGVPVWTAEKVYEFLKMKDEAVFSDFTWLRNKLSFNLHSGLKHPGGLTFLLPVDHSDLKISQIVIDGRNKAVEKLKIKGFEYALITVTPGATYKVLVDYQ